MSSPSHPRARKSSPYEINASFTSPKNDTFRFVAFSPWTSETHESKEFASRPSLEYQQAWTGLVQHWSGVAAIVSSNSVTFLRLRDTEPHQLILKISEPPPSTERGGLFALAWSFDPVHLAPIVAFAGKSNLIYVWRLRCAGGSYAAQRIRVLTGHGEEIYALKFHPTFPHILASASRDTTVRIWNVLAPESPLSTYRVPAMGMGNEGPVLVAILAGGTVGGHVEGVTALAFHSNLPIIATGGLDHTLKIWPLPRFPPPYPAQDRNSPHKTFQCHHPLFSSRLIHSGIINGISWYDEVTLLSFSDYPHSKVVKWRWLAMHHHFPLQPAGGRLVRYGDSGKEKDALRVQRSEYDDSYSYHILTTYYPPSPPSSIRHPPTTSSTTSGCLSPLQPSWTNHSCLHLPNSVGSLSHPPPSLFLIPLPPTTTSSTTPGLAIFHPDEPIPPRPNRPIPKVPFAPDNHSDASSSSSSPSSEEDRSAPITRPGHRDNLFHSSASSKGKGREREREFERESEINVFPRRTEDDENEVELRKWVGDAEGTTCWVLKAYTVLGPPEFEVEGESEEMDVDLDLQETTSQEVERRRNSPRKRKQVVVDRLEEDGQGGARVVKGKGFGGVGVRRIVSDDEEGGRVEGERERKERKKLAGMRVRGVAVSGEGEPKWVVGVGERKVWVWRREG